MFKSSSNKDLLFTSYLFFSLKMGKGKTVTGIECGWILELHRPNLSQCVIASEIGRSKTVIANFIKDPGAYGTKKHTERPKKILLALGRRIRREVRKS